MRRDRAQAEPAKPGNGVPRGPTVIALKPVFDFHIDRCSRGEIAGWIADPTDPRRALDVEFLLDGIPVGIASARMVRVDVEKAGRGPRACGFHFAVPPPVADLALTKDIPVTLRVAGAGAPFVELFLSEERSVSGEVRLGLDGALRDALTMASTALHHADGEPLAAFEPARYPLHEKLFLAQGAGRANGTGHELSPYLAFTRRRLRQETKFPLDGSEAAAAHYLRWYLDSYCHQRKPFRTPLGAAEIAYLNAPVRLVGLPYKVSRITLSYALTETDAARRLPVETLSQYEGLVAWWSAARAPALNVEDCLVPDYYVEVLRRVPIPSMAEEWPLSVFMTWFFQNEKRFQVLAPQWAEDRLLYHVWYLLEAVKRPGLIRFVPPKNLSALFEGEAGTTLFDRTLQALHEAGANLAGVFDAALYADLLRRRGFDLARRRFTTIDAAGHRFDAAARPPASVPRKERVTLQVIGPLQKSSGLGQAARLSAETVRRTGIEANFVDFGLDNPAPVGMNRQLVSPGKPRPARINLIHLNGETVPIALAYMPDVFNGAYNIGYFFWELSTPAAPQRLALELLDEVWVATSFGVSVYQGAVDKPVQRVGMAFEPVATPEKAEARAELAQRVAIGRDTFVCLATFDSFSFLGRKNPHGLLAAFLAAFEGDDDVRLVLKTHNRDFVADARQQLEWDAIVEAANRDPRIVLINETMKFGDLIKLKKAADAYVSLHRAEGWGFGLIEAMSIGTPVLATAYSGNVDFTKPDNAFLVDYDLVEPEPNEYIFVERGQVWAAPKLDSAIAQLRAMRQDPGERERRAARAREFVHANYSLDAQAGKYRSRLEAILAMTGGR